MKKKFESFHVLPMSSSSSGIKSSMIWEWSGVQASMEALFHRSYSLIIEPQSWHILCPIYCLYFLAGLEVTFYALHSLYTFLKKKFPGMTFFFTAVEVSVEGLDILNLRKRILCLQAKVVKQILNWMCMYRQLTNLWIPIPIPICHTWLEPP